MTDDLDVPEEDIDIDIAHVRWRDGKCRISLNGQGHLPCSEHEPLPPT